MKKRNRVKGNRSLKKTHKHTARPAHQVLIEEIRRASHHDMQWLTRIMVTIAITQDHHAIAKKFVARLKKLGLAKEPFQHVIDRVMDQHFMAPKKGEGYINFDTLRKEARKLFRLLNDIQPGDTDWLDDMQASLEALHGITTKALNK